MKRNLKKMILTGLLSAVMIGVSIPNAFAEEAQTISINGTDTSFVEIFKVENGVTYLPIRLAFNNFVDQGYSVSVVPSIEKQNIAISVIRVDQTTGEVDNDRRGVFINWSDEITADESFSFGRLELYKYEKDANGNNFLPTENFQRPVALENKMIFLNVDDNGGQRAFMSLDDLNTMVQFLIDNSDYRVELK